LRKIDKEKYWFEGDFVGTSGKPLKGYWNFRIMIANKEDMWTLMLELETISPCNLHGMEFFGALAVAYASAYLEKKKSGYIIWRKEPDKTGRQFYGIPRPHLDNYIVDDVITTGGSIKPIVEYLHPSNVVEIRVLLNRSGKDTFWGIPIKEMGNGIVNVGTRLL